MPLRCYAIAQLFGNISDIFEKRSGIGGKGVFLWKYHLLSLGFSFYLIGADVLYYWEKKVKNHG